MSTYERVKMASHYRHRTEGRMESRYGAAETRAEIQYNSALRQAVIRRQMITHCKWTIALCALATVGFGVAILVGHFLHDVNMVLGGFGAFFALWAAFEWRQLQRHAQRLASMDAGVQQARLDLAAARATREQKEVRR